MNKEEALNRIMQLLHEINEVITHQKMKIEKREENDDSLTYKI